MAALGSLIRATAAAIRCSSGCLTCRFRSAGRTAIPATTPVILIRRRGTTLRGVVGLRTRVRTGIRFLRGLIRTATRVGLRIPTRVVVGD